MPSLSRDESRRLDRCAMERIGLDGLVLMENAGRGATEAILERYPDAGKVAIVAGAGNNGGDGFVIARHLAIRGVTAETFLTVSEEKLSGDAETNFHILRNLGRTIHAKDNVEFASLSERLATFDVVVDALGGTGIQGALRGEMAAAVAQVNKAGRPVVAVDIPTGLDCDTGPAEGPAVEAELTVTMVARKQGFDAAGADRYTGDIRIVDIGVSAEDLDRIGRTTSD